MQKLYDTIGSTYSASRCADPAIARELARLVQIGNDKKFLDLACGTGNYTNALASLGGDWHGVDISDVMINQAREKNFRIEWQLSSADALPFQDDFFDGAICTLAIHHFPELVAAFTEVKRVLNDGPFVIFTAFPDQMQEYWLCHYFPKMMCSSIQQMPTQEFVVTSLHSAGFEIEGVVPFEVTNDLQDLFLYSGRKRPTQYFDPLVRSNISSFASRCSSEELQTGLQLLRAHLESGEFENVARSYQSSHGDYAYVIANKCRG
jgi:SAM-dependent methyltransferase